MRAAREPPARAARWSWSTRRSGPPVADARRRRRARRCSAAARHRRRGQRRDGGRSSSELLATVGGRVLAGDVPLIERRDASPSWWSRTPRPGAAATMVTTVLDDPGGYGRVVRDADGDRRAGRRDEEPRATRRERRARRSARSTRASTPSTRARCCDALPRLDRRQRPGRAATCPTCSRCCAQTARGRRRSRSTTERLVLGVNDRVAARRGRAEPPSGGSSERHMLAGVTIVDPDAPCIDVDVRDRPGHGDRAVHARCAARRGRRAATIGPRHADRRAARRRRQRRALPLGADRRRRRDGRPVRLPAARRRAARGLEGRHVRRDQELRHRRRARRSRTCPTSATPTSASARTSARARSPPTTTALAKHRTTIGARRAHGGVDTMLVAPVSVGDGACTAAGSVITSDVPPGALAVAARAPAQHRGLRRAPRGARP